MRAGRLVGRYIRYTRRPECAKGPFTTRRQATSAATDGPLLTETNSKPLNSDSFKIYAERQGAEATLKRFWKTVGIEKRGDNLCVTLDKRPLKTPSGNNLLLPESKRVVATLIAAEWENQEKLLNTHALPITSIAARAIDAYMEEKARSTLRESLLAYLDTDAICFHQDDPPPLVELQAKHWDPLLRWARDAHGIEILTFKSVLFQSQPAATKQKLSEVMAQFDPWEMTAMERATYSAKSLLIALALIQRHITVEEAALAAQVEVASQIQRWGEVEDSHDIDFHDIRRQLGSAAALICTL